MQKTNVQVKNERYLENRYIVVSVCAEILWRQRGCEVKNWHYSG